MAFAVKRSALYCSLALTLPSITFADDTLVVTAQPAETAQSPTSGYTAKTSTGATKTDTPLITTGQSVSVVTRQQIEDQGASNINQALNYTPGVFTNFAGAATRFDTVSLRGFHGADTDNVFLDGLRLMSDSGSHNVLQIDPWFIERVDIIKGPSSALYGQTLPGGLVNLTSKRPQFDEEGHFRLSAGTQNTRGAAFDYTSAINEQWAFRITGMTRNSDTQYSHTREERYAISPSLLWQPTEDTSLLLRAYLQKEPSGGYHGSMPLDGSLNGHNGYKLGRDFYEGESDLDQYKRRQQIYSYDFSHRFNETWAFRSTASYTHSNVEMDQVFQNGWVDSTSDELARGYVGQSDSLDAVAIDNQLVASFTTGALEHEVALGAEYHQYKNDIMQRSGSASTLNVSTGASDSILTGYAESNSARRYYQTGVYLQDQIKLNNWHLDLSGRYDRLMAKTENYTTGRVNRRSDDHISGRASLLYAFDNGISPYVSYSQAISPSVLVDSSGNLLKPSTSEQYEAGVKYQPPGTADMYSIAAYDLTQDGVSQRDVAMGTSEPIGKAHSQGIELEAHNQITPRLKTIAGYTLNHMSFKETLDGTDGRTPYLTPNQMASFWGHYQFDYGISVGAGVRYIGKQWAANDNKTRIPDATLLDASIRADLGAWNNQLKGAFVQVNATNLADRDYVAACYGENYCYRGAERSVLATIGYDF